MSKSVTKRRKQNFLPNVSSQERILTEITNQENNCIIPTHIQKFNQELSKLDNYTKDKDVNSLYVKVLTFFEELGQKYNLDDFPGLSFVIDLHDPYGKLDDLYREYFGINYKEIEIYQPCDIFHVNKHLDNYIKESIEKDLLVIPDDYGGLDKIYFELAGKIIENLKILNKKTHFKTKKDTLIDEGTWTKLTIDAFFYSMIKFFDDNLDICWGESINKNTKGVDLTLDYDAIKINTKSTKNQQQGKKPEITVYWRDEHFETTICLVEANFGPFAPQFRKLSTSMLKDIEKYLGIGGIWFRNCVNIV